MRQEPEVIGSIGSNKVAKINGFVCLQLGGKKYIGVTKIKAVLANLEACRQFLIQYDVQKPAPVAAVAAPQSKEEIEAQLAKLQALLATIPQASAAPKGRFANA